MGSRLPAVCAGGLPHSRYGRRDRAKRGWSRGSDVSSLAGRPVRLRCVLHEAICFRFSPDKSAVLIQGQLARCRPCTGLRPSLGM